LSNYSNAADAINTAIEDPVPFIAEAPDTSVRLLRGFSGNKDATVREMTGADEEFLATLEAKSNLPYPEYVSALLKRTVINIGDLEVKKSPDIIDELIIGDRDILFLAVVKATYGKVRTYHLTCPHCKESTDLSIDVDEDFAVQGTEEDADKEISVTLRNGSVVKFRHPNGADSKIIGKKAKNPAEQNTLMISRCVITDVPNKEQWARNLNIGDRTKIIDAILEVKIGPKVGEVNDPCPSCGEQIILPLDWVSLLFG
jgi:ribosomal protein S27AE